MMSDAFRARMQGSEHPSMTGTPERWGPSPYRALRTVSDDIADLDGFAETFDPEDWGDPDRFGPEAQSRTDAALRVLSDVLDAAGDVLAAAGLQRLGRAGSTERLAVAVDRMGRAFGVSDVSDILEDPYRHG